LIVCELRLTSNVKSVKAGTLSDEVVADSHVTILCSCHQTRSVT